MSSEGTCYESVDMDMTWLDSLTIESEIASDLHPRMDHTFDPELGHRYNSFDEAMTPIRMQGPARFDYVGQALDNELESSNDRFEYQGYGDIPNNPNTMNNCMYPNEVRPRVSNMHIPSMSTPGYYSTLPNASSMPTTGSYYDTRPMTNACQDYGGTRYYDTMPMTMPMTNVCQDYGGTRQFVSNMTSNQNGLVNIDTNIHNHDRRMKGYGDEQRVNQQSYTAQPMPPQSYSNYPQMMYGTPSNNGLGASNKNVHWDQGDHANMIDDGSRDDRSHGSSPTAPVASGHIPINDSSEPNSTRIAKEVTKPACNDTPAKIDHGKRFTMKIDKYDGSSDWVDYIAYFERVSTWNAWSSDDKASMLAMQMTGIARRTVTDLPSTTCSNYNKLKDALTQRFNPEGQEHLHKSEFKKRHKKSDETIREYGYELRRMAARSFPSHDERSREEWIIDQFQTGLCNVGMQRHVFLKHPKTLEEAMSAASDYEMVETTVKKPTNVASLQSKDSKSLQQEISSLKHCKLIEAATDPS